jgi:hypothetical protein
MSNVEFTERLEAALTVPMTAAQQEFVDARVAAAVAGRHERVRGWRRLTTRNDEIAEEVDVSQLIVERTLAARHTRVHRHQWLLAVGLATLMVSLLIGPSALAGAKDWITHLGVVFVSRSDLARPTQPAPGATASGGTLALDLTVAEAQQRVPFAIRAPRALPASVIFRGAGVSSDGTAAVLSYRRADGEAGGLVLQIESRAVAGAGYVLPRDVVEETTVNGLPAMYAPGGWSGGGSWDKTIDAALLSWTDTDELTYVLQCSGLSLSRDALRHLAESLR